MNSEQLHASLDEMNFMRRHTRELPALECLALFTLAVLKQPRAAPIFLLRSTEVSNSFAPLFFRTCLNCLEGVPGTVIALPGNVQRY